MVENLPSFDWKKNFLDKRNLNSEISHIFHEFYRFGNISNIRLILCLQFGLKQSILTLKPMEIGKVFWSIVPHLASGFPSHSNFSLVRSTDMTSEILKQGGERCHLGDWIFEKKGGDAKTSMKLYDFQMFRLEQNILHSWRV